MARFKPTYIFESVEKIPFELLEKENIKGIMMDVDNTLIDIKGIIEKPKVKWIKEAKKLGYKICILSNSFNMTKIRKLSKELDVFGLGYASKPLLKGYKMAEVILDMPKDQIIMIGDQLFTDVYGANRFGIKSIFVRPINNKEGIITKVKRPIENMLLKKYIMKGNKE